MDIEEEIRKTKNEYERERRKSINFLKMIIKRKLEKKEKKKEKYDGERDFYNDSFP